LLFLLFSNLDLINVVNSSWAEAFVFVVPLLFSESMLKVKSQLRLRLFGMAAKGEEKIIESYL
jgi:hypothetical protein